MADKKKVMTWLEICGKNRDCSGTCPYSENGFGEYGECSETLMTDALELLKEQEERTKGHWMPGKDWANEHYCSECHYRAIMKKLDWQYCPRCGANMRL